MYISRTKFNYKITKNTAIITGTLSVKSRNKMIKSQCASKREIDNQGNHSRQLSTHSLIHVFSHPLIKVFCYLLECSYDQRCMNGFDSRQFYINFNITCCFSQGSGVSDGRRSQRFNIVSLLVFESFISNFIMSEHKLTYYYKILSCQNKTSSANKLVERKVNFILLLRKSAEIS